MLLLERVCLLDYVGDGVGAVDGELPVLLAVVLGFVDCFAEL